MSPRIVLVVTVSFCLLMLTCQGKSFDPYKVLGVERNASQREIQKAFHKLSLQYHPDKNKNKGAQEKFAEINNAYEILSHEEKRKNYDLYGDEKGNPGFNAGYPGDQNGYTHFTSGGQGQNGFTFRPGEWQNVGGQGGSRSFSFSFGGPSSQNSFDFGMGDIFSNLFGAGVGGSQFSGFSGSARSNSRFKSGSRSSSRSSRVINSQTFKKEIADQGMTWLLLSFTPSLRGTQYYESVVQDVADSLEGALKVGSINCETEMSFCKELGIHPQRAPRLFVYSWSRDKGSLLEFSDDLIAKNLKAFCQDHLPRLSTRIALKQLESLSSSGQKLPIVVLLSTKRNTPVIWRVLSGLYREHFIFYDVEVHDANDATVRKLGVDALPAIVGFSLNGEKHILNTGISVKDIRSAVHDLSLLLDGFEKKNRKADASWTKKAKSDYDDKRMPLLTRSNFDSLCGETNPVCIIGAFKSLKSREKLDYILKMVSQKSLSRRKNSLTGSGDSISYALLDANAQLGFLNSLDKSLFKSSDRLLLAYKPRKGKFAAYKGKMNEEEVERFISAVLNGDVQFAKTSQKPVVK